MTTAAAAAAVIVVFGAVTVAFGRLALRTEDAIARGVRSERSFVRTATVALDEMHVTYAEYQRVPGFEDEKAALAEFLREMRVLPGAGPDAGDDRRALWLHGGRRR